MPQDWSLYEADVTKHYLEDGRNASDTIGIINRKHGCSITIRQFKSKYGGLKKLQAREWKVVGDEVKKRQALGQESCVFLHNRLQDPARVKREIRHYSNHVPDKNNDKIDIGIETVAKHRIEIRSPVTSHADHLPTSNANVVALTADVSDIEDNIHSSHSAEPCQPTVIGELSHEISIERNDILCTPLLSPSFYRMAGIGSVFGVQELNPSTSRDASNRHAEFNFNELSQVESNLLIGDSNDFWSRPWDIDLIMSENISPKRIHLLFWNEPEFISIFSSLTSSCMTPSGYTPPAVPQGNRGWLLTHLADITPNLPGIQSFAEQIEEVLPKTPKERKTQAALDNATPELLHCAFSVVAYLASNNLLDDLQLKAFVDWVIDNHHFASLARFAQMKSKNVREFIAKILLAACPPWPKVLVQYSTASYLHDRNIHERHYDNVFDVYPLESIHMLRYIDRRALLGSIGTKLLIAVSSSDHEQAAKFLIDHGANLNGNRDGNPLIFSIARGSGVISKHLINAGADVNIAFHPKDAQITPLLAAVAYQRRDILIALLEAGAKVDVMARFGNGSLAYSQILDRTARYYPELHELLVKHMVSDDLSETWLMVEQAHKGNKALADFLFARKITESEQLERGLYYAVKWSNLEAVRTFLSRGVDANATQFRLKNKQSANITNLDNGEPDSHEADSSNDFHPLLLAVKCSSYVIASIIHLLVQHGGKIDKLPNIYVPIKHLMALIYAGHDMSELGPSILEETRTLDTNLQDIGIILDAGCPINNYGTKGRSAIQIAASFVYGGTGLLGDNVTVVQYLIDRGANVNLAASENGGRTALQAALEHCNLEVVDCLLSAGADVMALPAKTNGLTTLEAAARGFSVCMNQRFENQVLESYQIRKLEKAVETFKWLFARGAPVARADGDGGQLFHILIDAQNAECLEFVLKGGAVADGPSISFWPFRNPNQLLEPMTPLQFAAGKLWLDGTVLLLQNGANVNTPAVSAHGLTALQAASGPIKLHRMQDIDRKAQIEVVKLLLQSSAEVNAPAADEYGRTALQAACSEHRPNHQLIRLLLEHKADVNAQPARVGGITALQGAVIVGDTPLVKILLQKGADIHAPASEEEGRTAVEGAAEHGRLDLLRLLFNEGAKPDEATGFSKAVELAMKNENWAIVDLLQEEQRGWGLQPLPLSN